ncbi:LrgB family protein [Shouchella shacheensis]|uniref:LrgB family protein n=1 Tax=Shouchella shacheensis TaxID=1649580 RepID=UPI0007400838|nr:LrgB family protein [Shouchella shacheensis]
MKTLTIVLASIGTIAVYLVARSLQKRIPHPLLLPLLVATAFISVMLVIFQIPYETYRFGSDWMTQLLGPAVVALAYPLYRQLPLLKTYLRPLLLSITVGAVVGMGSGWILARIAGLGREWLDSILPKSVTMPVAMDISVSLQGEAALTAILVTAAGLTGATFGPYLFKWVKITHFLGKGIGYGAGSHAIGTAKALEDNEKEGAVSSVSMTICAIIVSLLAPVFTYLVY